MAGPRAVSLATNGLLIRAPGRFERHCLPPLWLLVLVLAPLVLLFLALILIPGCFHRRIRATGRAFAAGADFWVVADGVVVAFGGQIAAAVLRRHSCCYRRHPGLFVEVAI